MGQACRVGGTCRSRKQSLLQVINQPASSLVKGEEKEKMAQVCTYGEKGGREIAFIHILPWARHYPTEELTRPHTSLQDVGIG